MGRIAFVFSGQGDQYSGMGSGICSKYESAKKVFEICDAIRPDTSEQCFFGSTKELKETKHTQPCMFAMEMAGAAALESLGLRADMAAGFSLGELSALTYAGVLTLREGFSLVCRRGELMQCASENQAASMSAVIGLTVDQVETICGRFDGIYPVNYNCPGQVTVSGDASAMNEFSAAVKQAGGRAIPLKVRGAFHSPFMSGAAEAFAAEIDGVCMSDPSIDIYSNVTAEPYCGSIRNTLAGQMTSPVLWEKTIRNMIKDGADTFIEIGPGKTLCGFIARIDSNVRTFPISAFDDLHEMIREVKKC